jgi:hypothetical protein
MFFVFEGRKNISLLSGIQNKNEVIGISFPKINNLNEYLNPFLI